MTLQPITIDSRVGTVLFINDAWQPVDREYATFAHVSFDDGGSAFYKVSALKAAGGPGSGRYPKGSGKKDNERRYAPSNDVGIGQLGGQLLNEFGETTKPSQTRFVLPDGTRVGQGQFTMAHEDYAEMIGSNVRELSDVGIIRYIPKSGIEISSVLTDAQAQLIADDWTYHYKTPLAIDIYRQETLLASRQFPSPKADTIRNFVKQTLNPKTLGGAGSGNFGHAGREGKVGGSSKVTDSKAFKSWFGSSKVVDENGDPLVVYHGTTHDITQFGEAGDPMYNPESDWGAAAYFTDSTEDMSANYAGIGPDLTSRIEQRAERIQQESEDSDPGYHMTMTEAQKLATKELTGHAHEGVAMPVYVKMDTPFVVGQREGHPVKETYLTHSFEYDDPNDPDSEITGATGTLVKFTESLRHEAHNFYETEGVEDFITNVTEHGMDGGISASKLDSMWRKQETLGYITDDNGRLVSHELYRRALQGAGFDGVIDRTVNQKFGSEKQYGRPMEGMDESTTHYIAFAPPNVKSAIGNTKFDPKNPLITMRAYSRETAVHKAADLHVAKMQSAIDFAFAAGRAAVDHPLLKRATNQTDAERAVTGVPEAVAAALRDVLPGTLGPILEAGGNAGLSMLRPRLKAAGGAGSGNFGHAGREGKVGGSANVAMSIKNETWYHGSTATDLTAFSNAKIKGTDYDAPYTGIWLSNDEMTSPAMINPKALYQVEPIKVDKVITRPEANLFARALKKEPDYEEKLRASGAKGDGDYTRMRLLEAGYDVVLHQEKPVIDVEELERTGSTKFKLGWRDSELRKEPLYANEPNGPISYDLYQRGDHITGYESPQQLIDQVEREIVILDANNARITKVLPSPWLDRGASMSVLPLLMAASLASDFRTARPQVKGQPHTVVGKFGLSFNATNPNSVKWVQDHTLELSEDLSETTKHDVAVALERALLEGDRDQLYEDVLDAVGSPKRAALIAHHEPMVAAGEGQRQSWDQAIDAGLLDGDERVEWIATADAVVCPVCARLNGKTRKIDGEYPRPGGIGPPQHVRCRCTEGISADMRGAAGFDEFEHPRDKDGKWTHSPSGSVNDESSAERVRKSLSTMPTGSRLIIGGKGFESTGKGWSLNDNLFTDQQMSDSFMTLLNEGLMVDDLTEEQKKEAAEKLAAKAKEHASRTPLYAFAMGSTADWSSTAWALAHGAHEKNPTIAWLKSPPAIIAAGAGLDALGAYAWMKATKDHKKIQAVGFFLITATRGYFVIHNIRASRKQPLF